MTGIEILPGSRSPGDAHDLFAGTIDEPFAEGQHAGATFNISGWVLGREVPPVAVTVSYAGMQLRSTPITIARPDVAAYHPDYPYPYPAARSGFFTTVGGVGLPPEFTLQLHVVLADGRHVPWQQIHGRHTPQPSPFHPEISPLMVTCLGRSGTTLVMELLGTHPEIVVQHIYPYETRAATYWMHLVKTLGEPGNYFAAADWVPYFEDFAQARPNPFANPRYAADAPIRDWFGGEYRQRLTQFCQESTDAFYREVARSQGQARPQYFAEKYFPGLVSDMTWQLYPQVREVFVVRDARDMLCSVASFLSKPRRTLLSHANGTPIHRLLDVMQHDVRQLLEGWKRRAARAHLVRYEDLVQHPDQTLRDLFAYLDLDAAPTMIEEIIRQGFRETPDLQDHRTTRDVAASIGRWRNDLDPALWERYQAGYAEYLQTFGYT